VFVAAAVFDLTVVAVMVYFARRNYQALVRSSHL